MNPKLTIDPEFEAKCPPLTEGELAQLEENIIEEGIVFTPIIVWNNTIVDGHNRYKIIQEHPEIEFRTHEKHFENRYEALSWICRNQLGRRNLTPMQKKYLIGERYDAEKMVHGGDRKSEDAKSSDKSCHLESESRTRKRIAEESGISEGSVQNAFNYAKGVNAADEVLPGIKNDLLLGKYKPKEADVAAIARTSLEDRKKKAEQLKIVSGKEPKITNGNTHSAKRHRQLYAEIDQVYEGLKAPKRANEDSALVSLRYVARNMIETCDVLFENFPGLLSKPIYKAQVVDILQEPKQYILKLEDDKVTEISVNHSTG